MHEHALVRLERTRRGREQERRAVCAACGPDPRWWPTAARALAAFREHAGIEVPPRA